MAQQRRPIELKFHVTPEEKAIIEKKNTTKYKTIKVLNGLKDIFRNVIEFSKTIPQFIVSAVGIMSMYSSKPLKKSLR